MKYLRLLTLVLACAVGAGYAETKEKSAKEESKPKEDKMEKVVKTDEEWKKILTPEQYEVTRHAATERPGGKAYKEFEAQGKGAYYCVACGLKLFESSQKFDSGCGWPSFYDKATATGIKEIVDKSHGMERTEVQCARCDSHLGHVFNDGPKPTGLRYCINAASIKFVPAGKEVSEKPEEKK